MGYDSEMALRYHPDTGHGSREDTSNPDRLGLWHGHSL